MPNRVLVCSNYYPPTFIGGAELIAHQQALTLRELGWEVVVFAGDPPGKAARYTRRRETFEGLRVHRVGLAQADFDPEFANFSQPAVEREFEAVLDAERPDVVHFHNLIGLSIGLIRVARRRGLKTALTVHDHWGICHNNTLMKRDMEICTDHTRCA